MDENGLSERQLEKLEARLNQLREELTEQLGLSEAGAQPVDLEEPIGRLSRMDAISQQRMVQAGRRAAKARLQQIAAALLALERGQYGACRLCEEPIGWKRLAAKPEAALCVGCQEQRER